ncbi:hypothetical protein HPB47_000877 [Ixodes persulcatus]|uniref:Uncharacterized protein n=1 Tax=Ixodes persulcatus TaxID=34615 RepID=A0AC60PQN5_IXOPE|nr:hypothetical protein HPB47_000877 [Ixodes persulcatus]
MQKKQAPSRWWRPAPLHDCGHSELRRYRPSPPPPPSALSETDVAECPAEAILRAQDAIYGFLYDPACAGQDAVSARGARGVQCPSKLTHARTASLSFVK